jgi:dihydrofolate reductase
MTAKLIYSAIASLDGYVEDREGRFDWAAPDDEVHGFVNDLERPIRTYLYGRRMYETMTFWETVDPAGDQPAVLRDFADLASRREDRLLPEPRQGRQRKDPDRARVRHERSAAAQGELAIGHHDRRR